MGRLITANDSGKMILFKGKCIDARYGYEGKFLQEIQGRGFKNDEYSAYIEESPGTWLEVEKETVEIIKR